MRSLDELIDESEPAWPLVQDWLYGAELDHEVLPASPEAGRQALYEMQVTSRSPMGAVVLNTAGILVNSRWLRILGAGGHELIERSLQGWNAGKTDGFLLVADDAVGGFFAVNGGGLGEHHGHVFYFAPDDLAWEDLGVGYSDFLIWALTERVHTFYERFYWPGWQEEVAALTGDEAIHIYPYLCAEGGPIGERSRKSVPMEEMYRLQMELVEQLGSYETGPAP